MKRTFIDYFLGWIASRLDLAYKNHQLETFHRVATISASAQIESEGFIENNFGDPSCIKIGDQSHIRGRLLTYGHGGEISIGEWCYVGARSEIWSMDSITIGNRVLIAHGVNINDGSGHSLNAEERHHHYRAILEKGHPYSWAELPGIKSAPIVIEDDVWISFGVTILQGVHIGKGCVIAAGSIVTKDIPPYTLYRNEIIPVLRSIDNKEINDSSSLVK